MQLTEFKVTIKKKGSQKIDREKVSQSEDAARVCKKVMDADTIEYTEEVVLLLFNRAMEFIGFSKIGMGGTTGAVMDPKIIFTTALQANAHSIMIAHNHPSGNAKPSEADERLTHKLSKAGELLDIRLVDHLILSGADENYYSFADAGKV